MDSTIKKTQRGFTLIEMTLAIFVASVGFLAIADYSQKNVEEMKTQVSGDYMASIGKAAKAYIDDNYHTIVGIATATTPFELDVNTLVASNYLPTGYSATNPFGQQIKVLVLEPQVNKLNGLVISTGGEQLDDVSLSQYVTQIGASGGGVYSETPTVITGARGLWEMSPGAFQNATDLGNSYTIGQGHAVIALWYDSNQSTSGFLYRDQIASHPELNRMNTDIDMGSNNVNNATSVNATTEVKGPVFVDADNNFFYVDPSGGSIMNQVQANAFYDLNDGAFYVDPNGISILNDVRPSIIYDRDSISYYVDPNGTSHTNVLHTNQLFTGASIQAPAMHDRDDNNFYLDPNGMSVMNDVRPSIIYDRDDANFYVDPGATSHTNSLHTNLLFTGASIQAPAMHDRDDNNYYIDPNGVSRTNINVPNWIDIQGVVTAGDACSTPGRMAKNSIGRILNCQDGTYQLVGAEMVMKSSVIYANAGQTTTLNMGVKKFCALNYVFKDSRFSGSCSVTPAMSPFSYTPTTWTLAATKAPGSDGLATACSAVCF
ncbi:hypothetical protein CYQ88_08270 [Hydrogenovibrio sp. SC-1]|uniref:shufflon system plasmid conjugative transfer pilus tip adhesin PilV n=1 Tax=Hydrogenovibrio sp. SC-1 TaxID=2065820 RepID=UPI000C7DAB9B|nr:shufflon system plasmid conjugative transfer pilus tip adhesin PilV [Hydrogenovibrio sp. SC-1]PLA74009.1 hypothetical protein CYQ88_08270 [Hydrogenovibrio sp. SC-1]